MKSLLRLLIALMLIGLTYKAECQIRVDLKKKIVNQTNNRVNQRADQAIDKGLDAVENSVKESAKKDEKNDQGQETQQDQGNNQSEDNQSAGDSNREAKPSSQEQTQMQTFSKYDFIPGEKVIFFDDFSQDAVGDFPALWNTNGSAEVVTTNLFPGKWMKFVCREAIWTDQLFKLPENYTIEFDVVPVKGEEGHMDGYGFRLMQSINEKSFDHGAVPGEAAFYYHVEYFGRPGYRTYINGEEGDGLGLTGYKDGDEFMEKENRKYHIALWVQKSRVRLYQDEKKLFDLPRAFPVTSVKMDRIRFEDGAAMISNVRIAVGAPDMRNKLQIGRASCRERLLISVVAV